MIEFDYKAHIVKCSKDITKLLQQLASKGIEFTATDPTLWNVVFFKGDKQLHMSFHSFYRYSGRAVYYKENKAENTMTPYELTYEMYLATIIKPIVEKHFEV